MTNFKASFKVKLPFFLSLDVIYYCIFEWLAAPCFHPINWMCNRELQPLFLVHIHLTYVSLWLWIAIYLVTLIQRGERLLLFVDVITVDVITNFNDSTFHLFQKKNTTIKIYMHKEWILICCWEEVYTAIKRLHLLRRKISLFDARKWRIEI